MVEKKYAFGVIKYDPKECIVYTEYNEGLIINLDLARVIREKIYEITGKDKFSIISNMEKIALIDSDARHYLAKDQQKRIIAAVSIVKNFFHRNFANLFIKFANIEYTYKFFSSEDEALKWLKEYTAKHCEKK